MVPHELSTDLVPTADAQKCIVFVAGTRGTSQTWSRRFFAIATEICVTIRCHGVLLGGDVGPNTNRLVSWSRFHPLREILPYACAIVHHAGIGTAAAAIEFGIPQMVIPRIFAQSSNARWLRDLRLAVVMREHDFCLRRGLEGIDALVRGCVWRDNARRFARRCSPQDLRERLLAFPEHRRGL